VNRPPDAETLGQQLIRLDPRITATKDHINREFIATDGIAATAYDGSPHGNDPGHPVERVILQRAHLLEHMYQINDCLDAIESINRELNRLCNKALGTRIAHTVERCYADPGMAGYLVPLEDGGWHDPTCQEASRSASGGLCDKHRKAAERWRERHEMKPLTDERPVTYDSVVRYVNDVAIIRPIRGAA